MDLDLFDVVCRLDEDAEWLDAAGYEDEARILVEMSTVLKGDIVLVAKPDAESAE